MKRFIVKKTPADFYFEEMNFRGEIKENVKYFAVPINDYTIGDLITFDYGFSWCDGKFNIQRTFKIEEIATHDEEAFSLNKNGLMAITGHYHDHTKDSKEMQAETEVIEV